MEIRKVHGVSLCARSLGAWSLILARRDNDQAFARCTAWLGSLSEGDKRDSKHGDQAMTLLRSQHLGLGPGEIYRARLAGRSNKTRM